MENRVTSILLSGVGGQGIILASELICDVLVSCGFDVKKNEIHGMSQRGGSVTSHIRFGEKVASPVIPAGEANYLLGFEKLEGFRYLYMLREGGLLLMNDYELVPSSMVVKKVSLYPADLSDRIDASGAGAKTTWIKAQEIAEKLGNPRTANIVLVGLLAGKLQKSQENLSVDQAAWNRALEARVKPRYVEINKKAFAEGWNRSE
jgi:indolepyruvate ferredoxin oxidoreductase beta subunit